MSSRLDSLRVEVIEFSSPVQRPCRFRCGGRRARSPMHRRLLACFLFFDAWLSLFASAGPIDTVAKLRALSWEAADRHLPVRIEGTVTYFDPGSGSRAKTDLFVQDATGGTWVGKCQPGTKLKAGDRVRLEGWSNRGGFYPDVVVDSENSHHAPLVSENPVKVLGKGEWPTPRVVRENELFLPELTGQWVEVRATITGVETGGIAFTLAAEVNGWKITIEIPKDEHSAERAAALMQRSVRIFGVADTVFNLDRQMTGRFLFVPSFEFITPVNDVASCSPPLRASNELLQKSDRLDTRVCVKGVVTQVASNGFYLRDDQGCLRIITAPCGAIAMGDRVEVEGFAAIAPFRPILKATHVAVQGHGAAPLPVALDLTRKSLFRFHGDLVALDAEFLIRHDGPVETTLQCRTNGWIIEAILPVTESLSKRLTEGDRLRLTGILELTTTHPTPRVQWVDGCRLHLSKAGGLRVLRRAPWWTLRNLMIVLGIVSAVASGALTWVWMLRRTVQDQTKTIVAKVKREGILEERQRIARELHDTVEQGLTGLWMQFGIIARDLQNVPEGVASEFRFAQQMLRYCREEARSSVRDLRNIELEQRGLPWAMKEMLPIFGASCGGRLQFEVTGDVRPVGATVENHLLRIAQEGVSNALRHGAPRKVQVSLVYGPGSLTLEICDDGCGFDSSAPEPPGHFGLRGIRERADKMQANLTVESAPGAGAKVRIVVPQSHEK